jgi:hypothetical protein
LTQEQKKEKCLQQRQELAAKKRGEASTSKTKGGKNQEPPQARPPHARTQPHQSLEMFLKEQVLPGSWPTLNLAWRGRNTRKGLLPKQTFMSCFGAMPARSIAIQKFNTNQFLASTKTVRIDAKSMVGLPC